LQNILYLVEFNTVNITAINKNTSMSFPLVGNLSKNPEGLRQAAMTKSDKNIA